MSKFALIIIYAHYKEACYEDGISPGGNMFKALTAIVALAEMCIRDSTGARGLSHRLAAGAGRPEIPAQPAYGEYG